MIANASKRMTQVLLKNNIINETDAEICQYGLEIIFATLIGLFLVLLIGLLFGNFTGSIIFYSVFIIIRFFTGGYHASTHFRCKMLLCLCCSAILGTAKYCKHFYNIEIQTLLLIVSWFIIIILAPVEHKNAPADSDVKKKNRKIAIAISLVLIMSLSFRALMLDRLSIIVTLTMVVISILLILGKKTEGSEKNVKE